MADDAVRGAGFRYDRAVSTAVGERTRASFERALEVVRLRGMIAVRAAATDDDPLADELAALEAAHAAAPSPRMTELATRLGLSPDVVELLWFAVAWASDPMLTPHLHVLVAEPQRGATLAAFARVVGWEPVRLRRLAREFLRSNHPVFAARMLVPSALPLGPLTSLTAPERLVDYLAGGDDVDPRVAALGGRVVLPSMVTFEDATRPTSERIALALADAEPVALMVTGPDGVGRRTLVADAAAGLGRAVVAIDLARIPVGAGIDDALAALTREVTLTGAVPMIVGAETTHGESPDAVARRGALVAFLGRAPSAVALAATVPGLELDAGVPVVRFAIAVPEPATRATLWQIALAGAAIDDEVVREVALRYRLAPAAIGRAAAAARVVTRSRGAAEPTAADLAEGIRLSTQERLGGLAHRIEPRHDWNDLVLPEETRDEIAAVVARARFAYRVLGEWGFARHVSGQGIAALFSGPPGTGKTMVAGLIARELNLDLYRVDLSQVVSKWIGETEKQLARVFDAAETGHVLLLFDEADALFAKRTEVKGASERYANLEVNFLLQRIETFAGLAVLTTNLDGSIDDAFRRRLAAHVHFPPPGEDERTLLWQRLLPTAAPTEGTIDAGSLSERFPDFAGGHIRNATLNAAFLAAAEGGRISQRHLEHAARDVARSMGRVLAQPGRG